MAERAAINTPLQGTAADMIKVAMICIFKKLKEQGLSSRMILQVHDELVFEAPPKEKKALIDLVRDKMEHTIKLVVPVEVSVKVGKNWLDMEEV